jgi:hypothetical protein
MVLERLWSGIGQTIPFACQDWSSTKAAYRFLSNERVSEQEILSGHFHVRISAIVDGHFSLMVDVVSA